MQPADNTLEAAIRTVLTQHTDVQAGYLFGSAGTGKRGPLSDIDIAVLVEPSASRRSPVGDIQDALCRALRTDDLDLISLAEAPPPVAYRVVRDGRCIYCRDRKAREGFETCAVMRYLDMKPLRDLAFHTSRKRILEAR